MSEPPPDRDDTPDDVDFSRPVPAREPWPSKPHKPGPKPPPRYATEVVHVEGDAVPEEDNDDNA